MDGAGVVYLRLQLAPDSSGTGSTQPDSNTGIAVPAGALTEK